MHNKHSIPIGHSFVCNLYHIWKVVGLCDLAYVLGDASLPSSTAFIFESVLLRILTTSKLAMLSSIPDTSKVVLPHPFETFHSLTNYSNFEANIIHPAICAAHSRPELSQAPDPGHPVFTVPCPSLEETLQFLLDIVMAINIVFLLLFLLQNFLQQFL